MHKVYKNSQKRRVTGQSPGNAAESGHKPAGRYYNKEANMKKIIVIAAVALLMGCSSEPSSVSVYNAECLTAETLAETLAETDTEIVVSVTHGVCLDAETGDGQTANGYISYSVVDGVQTGDEITTYYIYTAESADIDDIEYRHDVIAP